MKAVLAQLEKVIDTRATVCIEGETGTGKELIASAIHYQSRRHDKLFVAQNCAALPENLLESELFGHKHGAFTGADSDKKGLFEIADGGTLFLDEIGEMPLSLQAKLLRVLQEGTIRPVGATSEKQVDVRIICATNRDLAAEVEKGALPPGPLLPADGVPDPAAAAARAARGHPAARRALPQALRRGVPARARRASRRRRSTRSPATPGPATSASSRTRSSASSSRPSRATGSRSPICRRGSARSRARVTRIAPKKGTLKEMMEQVERWLLTEALRDHDDNKTRTAGDARHHPRGPAQEARQVRRVIPGARVVNEPLSETLADRERWVANQKKRSVMSFAGKLLLAGVAALVFITLITGTVSIAALHRTTSDPGEGRS